jgi:aspartate aminotransferase-like enzyme
MLKYHERQQTPATPAIPQIFALDAQLTDMLAEGLPARHARHRALAALCQQWARQRFALFAEEGFASDTLTCVANTRGISVAELNKELGRQAATISNGYGDLKEKTFRIAHMGDTQEWEIRGLLATIDRILKLT